MAAFDLRLPLHVLGYARLRLELGQVIFLPEEKQHRIGVGLNVAALTQIGKLWPLVISFLDFSIELHEQDDDDIQLLGQRLQTTA